MIVMQWYPSFTLVIPLQYAHASPDNYNVIMWFQTDLCNFVAQ